MARTARQQNVPRTPKEEPRTRRAIEALARETAELRALIAGASGDPMTAYGLFAARPAVGVEGRQYWASDSPLVYLEDGVTWYAHHPRTRQRLTATWPQIGSFTQVNFGVGTTATQGGDDTLLHDAATAGVSVRLLVRAVPATPYTITAAVNVNVGKAVAGLGLFWRASGSGKLDSCLFQHDAGAIAFYHGFWDSPTVFNSAVSNFNYCHGIPAFVRISDDGTNRKCWASVDGINFAQLSLTARTNFITANQVGIGWYSQNAAVVTNINWLSWNQAGGL